MALRPHPCLSRTNPPEQAGGWIVCAPTAPCGSRGDPHDSPRRLGARSVSRASGNDPTFPRSTTTILGPPRASGGTSGAVTTPRSPIPYMPRASGDGSGLRTALVECLLRVLAPVALCSRQCAVEHEGGDRHPGASSHSDGCVALVPSHAVDFVVLGREALICLVVPRLALTVCLGVWPSMPDGAFVDISGTHRGGQSTWMRSILHRSSASARYRSWRSSRAPLSKTAYGLNGSPVR